jgi:hypothetical protein
MADFFCRRSDLEQFTAGDLSLYERHMGAGFVFVGLIVPGAHFPVAISINLGGHLFLGPSRLRGTDDEQEEQDHGADCGSFHISLSVRDHDPPLIIHVNLPVRLDGLNYAMREGSDFE